MAKATFETRIRKWGHARAVRIPQQDLSRLHAREGAKVRVTIETDPSPIDFNDVTVFRGPDSRGSRDHDRLLAAAADAEARRWRRRA